MKDNFLRTIPLQLYLLVIITPFLIFTLNLKLFSIVIYLYVIYGLYKTITLTYGVVRGYIEFKKETKIDWYKRLNSEYKNIPMHLIAIPVNNEDVSVLTRNIDSIVNQKYDANLIYVAVSIEESAKFDSISKQLINMYRNSLGNRLIVVKHILKPNEARGAASNRTNAVSAAVEHLRNNNISTSNFLITSPDADTIFDSQYLGRTSYQWAQEGYRSNVFYQTGAYIFDNNAHRVPTLISIFSFGITLGTLSSAVTDHSYRYTFSCFTLPLSTLVEVNYWDTTLSIDDSPLYWRIYKHFNGSFSCTSFFIPIHVDCIESSNRLNNYKRQYNQIHRWGWGIVVFPDALNAIATASASIIEKMIMLWKLIDSMILLKVMPATIIFYLTFFKQYLDITSSLSLISFILILFTAPIVYKLMRENSKMSLIGIIVNIVLFLPAGLINVYIYCLFPFMQAAIEFALGKDVNKKIQWAIKLPAENSI